MNTVEAASKAEIDLIQLVSLIFGLGIFAFWIG
jgi:hypothetical protein